MFGWRGKVLVVDYGHLNYGIPECRNGRKLYP